MSKELKPKQRAVPSLALKPIAKPGLKRLAKFLSTAKPEKVAEITEELIALCKDPDPKIRLDAMRLFYGTLMHAFEFNTPSKTQDGETAGRTRVSRDSLQQLLESFEKHRSEPVTDVGETAGP